MPEPPEEDLVHQGESGGGIVSRTGDGILGAGGGDEAAGVEVKLNGATFEELRELGFSVTQATRVITYRERRGGFKSVDELAEVPGMPRELVSDVSEKLTL